MSIEYRLCPEVNLLEGPMTDVRDALGWVRHDLPSMKLNCPRLQIDGDRVVAVGWSTGGTLAMSLGFTAPLYGIKAPEAVLAFYCPTNYDDDCESADTLTLPPFADYHRLQSPNLPTRCDKLSRRGLRPP